MYGSMAPSADDAVEPSPSFQTTDPAMAPPVSVSVAEGTDDSRSSRADDEHAAQHALGSPVKASKGRWSWAGSAATAAACVLVVGGAMVARDHISDFGGSSGTGRTIFAHTREEHRIAVDGHANETSWTSVVCYPEQVVDEEAYFTW